MGWTCPGCNTLNDTGLTSCRWCLAARPTGVEEMPYLTWHEKAGHGPASPDGPAPPARRQRPGWAIPVLLAGCVCLGMLLVMQTAYVSGGEMGERETAEAYGQGLAAMLFSVAFTLAAMPFLAPSGSHACSPSSLAAIHEPNRSSWRARSSSAVRCHSLCCAAQ